MKAKKSLLVLGVFAIAGAVTVSCGGSSGDDDDDSNTAGTTSTSAGTTSKAGTTGSSAGTSASSAGNNNGTGGTSGNNGGAPSTDGGAPVLGQGGGVTVTACPTGTRDGGACTLPSGARNACQLNATTYCSCQGDTDPAWICIDTNDLGTGGQGSGDLEATCPASPMNGDDCSGIGLCPDSTCVCFGNKVRYCQ